MQCKDCHSTLQCRARADLTYYECDQCGGVWFNQGELEMLISSRIRLSFPKPSREGSSAQTGAPGDCPFCGQGVKLVPMAFYATSHARIFGCPVCFGHWLSREQAISLIDHVCYRGPVGWLRRLFRRQSS